MKTQIVIRARQLTWLLSLIILQGCFEPEGEFYTELDKPSGDVSINLANQDNPLLIYQKISLTYQVNTAGYSVASIEGFLDDVSLYDPYSPTILIIDPDKFEQGHHRLRIEVLFHTNSGSLGDYIRGDLMVSREYDILIDLTPPSAPISIKRFRVDEGSFFVEWNKPSKINFLTYKVTRLRKNEDNGWYAAETIYLKNSAISFRDSLYVGGDIKYQIDLIGYKYTLPGIARDTTMEGVTVRIQNKGTNVVNFAWDKPLLSNNISSVYINSSFSPDEDGDLDSELWFGDLSLLQISTSPKYGSGYNSWGRFVHYFSGQQTTYKGLGKEITAGAQKFGEKYYIFERGQKSLVVNQVNPDNLSIEKTLDLTPYIQTQSEVAQPRYEITFSKDGKSLYLFVGKIAVAFDENLTLVRTTDISAAVVRDNFEALLPNVSNNNLATFRTYFGYSYLMDLTNGEVLYFASPKYSLDVSDDGNLLVFGDDVFDISDRSPDLLVSVPAGGSTNWIKFKTSSELIIQNGNEVSIFDVSSKTKTGDFNFLAEPIHIINYHTQSGYYSCITTGANETLYFNLVDLQTSSVIRRVPVFGDIYSYSYYFYDNTLVSSKGFKLDL